MGLGTQDSLEQAADFVADNGTVSFPMLWDPSSESWAVYGIQSQPAAILLEPGGQPITGWLGRFSPDDVLDLAAGVS
ncbi:MAG: hypothetical protein GY929_10430 [Actinomycetia bacterium]|nr:hypothetical protein [Actinomycetes bacterium]